MMNVRFVIYMLTTILNQVYLSQLSQLPKSFIHLQHYY